MVSFVVAGTQPPFPVILASWAFISLHFRSLGFISFHFSILGFMSFHFGLVGLHFLSFWPCGPSVPFILDFSESASGVPPTSCEKWPVCPTSLQWIYQRRDRLHFAVFSLVGLHFLAFSPCGPLFPCILALWAFISLHFGLVGLHFLAFWPCGPSFPCNLAFSESASRAPPTCCQKWPVCPTSLQWIYQRRDRLHFAVFSILGLHFLAFWACGPSFPCIFGLVGLHFLVFWPCGPSFPCKLAFSESASGAPPPQVAKNGPFAQRPYNGFISAVTGSILQFLALWAFISLHFGVVGLHFLAFWPCGPSFPCNLAFSESASRAPPHVAKNCPFAQRPYNGFISVVTGSILQFLAFWAFISLHFGLVGLHFLAFWPCGPSFLVTFWACNFNETASGQTQAVARSLCVPPLIGGLGG